MKILLNLANADPEALLARIRHGLQQATERLEMEILGPGLLLNDTALLLYDELCSRPSGLHIHANARTSLFDGAILLWLAADTREIRRDAWVQLSKIPSLPSRPSSWEGDCADDFKSALLIDEETPVETDLRTIAWHVSKWIPAYEIAGLRIFRDDLAEFGLIRSESAQLEFDSLFDNEMSFASGDPFRIPACTHSSQALKETTVRLQ